MKLRGGFTMLELLIVLGIFSVVMAGLYSAFSVQMRQGVRQYRLAESEMELQIARNIIERDLALAGFGIGDAYCDSPVADASCTVTTTQKKCTDAGLGFCTPVHACATNADPDTLTLMGTALGRDTRASTAWSYTLASNPTTSADFHSWTDGGYTVPTDARENLQDGDRIIYMEPNLRRILVATGANSITNSVYHFPFPPSGTNPHPDLTKYGTEGILVYGFLAGGSASQPYYVARYYLEGPPGSTLPSICAPNTKNLLRAESRSSMVPTGGAPVMNCALDFQVAFGLDTNDDSHIDCWDNGGATASTYDSETLKKRLKVTKVFVLLQSGAREQDYLYQSPDPEFATQPDRIRVGDVNLSACGGGSAGRIVQLSAEQRKYRWRVLQYSMAPRNISAPAK